MSYRDWSAKDEPLILRMFAFVVILIYKIIYYKKGLDEKHRHDERWRNLMKKN